MYDFKKNLFPDEEIIYTGKAVPGKGDKSLGGSLFLIGFSSVLLALMIYATLRDGFQFFQIIFYGVILLFLGIGVYNIIYNIFLKKHLVKDDYYCLTNLRVLKYESKKDKLVYGYLYYYDEIKTINNKGGYGDLYFGIVIDDENTDDKAVMKKLADLMTNPNPENMPFITFGSIEKPMSVMKLAKDARAKIKK